MSSRRTAPVVLLAAALLTTALLTACGTDDEAPAPGAAGDGAFPMTIEHRYGTAEIPHQPERVVAAGFTDADFALALGVVPVGVRDFIGPYPEENRPWAQDARGAVEPPKVGGQELNFERIAALDPDVILAWSYLEEDDYARLSQIAPTVVEPEEGSRWQEQTVITGRALGRKEQAEQLVADVEARFAEAAAEHPEFAGATAAVQFGDPSASFYLLEPTDPRWGFFASLGLSPPPEVGELSRERVDLLDQDVLVFVGASAAQLDADPLLSALPAVRNGRAVRLGGFDTEFAGALGFGSPLSLPYAIDIAAPQLAAALDGDPATAPDAGS